MKTIHTFGIDLTTPTGTYQGGFTVKKLSIRDLSAMGVRKAQLNGGLHYDPEAPGQGLDPATNELNALLAHLEFAVLDAPDWWDLEELADMRVVNEVYREVLDFEATFLGFGAEVADLRSGGSDEADRPKKKKAANKNRPSKTVVDSEVQSALEP